MNNAASKIFYFVCKPYGIVVVTALMSFAAWSMPGFGVIWKGYDTPQSLFSFGGLVLTVWYGTIFLISWFSYRVGRLSENIVNGLDMQVRLDDFTAYCFVSAVGAVGFVSVIVYLMRSFGLNEILLTIISGEANALHKQLYEKYTVGLLSLRYVLILSSGLAIYRIISRISHSFLDFANIIMLLLVAVIASRLSVVFAILIGSGLWIINQPKIKIRPGRWLILLFFVFIVFSLYNYSRNINFYISHGNGGFFAAGMSEIVKYLAAPFQGALAAGNQFDQIILDPHHSYLYTGIQKSLTTNSSLLGLICTDGNMFWPIMSATVLASSFIMGMLRRQRSNFLILVYFVLLYCYAEIWRVYIFNAGIMTTLLVVSLLTPIATRIIKSSIGLITYTASEKQTSSI